VIGVDYKVIAALPVVALPVNSENASPHRCHPDAQRKDLQLLPFAPPHPGGEVQDADLHEGSCFTYIMASRSRTLYVGVTENLQKRVFEHKWKERDGFTARYNCDRLVGFDRHQDVQRAIAREKKLKGRRRAKKIALVESANAAWVDLSHDWYD
jgi:putative endonuclease